MPTSSAAERGAAAVGLAVLAAAGCGGTRTVTVTTTRTTTRTVTAAAPCSGSDLRGRFAVEPGSAGAGQITYVLRLENASGSGCALAGLPSVTLLDGAGAALPTHVIAEPGGPPARRVVLGPGETAAATARFSPDVPGPGEGHPGRCEPEAVSLRVDAPGGGSVEAPVSPPTPVCSHGELRLRPFAPGG